MNKTYLLLGSNMGNSKEQITIAVKHIMKQVGKILRISSLYCTAAWGNTDQPDFLNCVLLIETNLNAWQTMKQVLSIEESMGRIRTKKFAPRMIDIDILFFNKAIIGEPSLTVPHPEIQNRRFALVPLNEMAPNLVHPVLKKTMHQLLLDCKDTLNVKKF